MYGGVILIRSAIGLSVSQSRNEVTRLVIRGVCVCMASRDNHFDVAAAITALVGGIGLSSG